MIRIWNNDPITPLLPKHWNKILVGQSPHGIVGNVLDSDNIVSKFELQISYYIHF